jgi:uncharacterized iron-regulated membrane protein
VLSLYAEFPIENPNDPRDHVHGHVTIDPRSGDTLPHDRLEIGSDFFYPMHYSLHLHWLDLGYWIVGVAALVMLAALVTGIVVHRKFLREFFTFRPQTNAQRRTLDLHNLTGVAALPFHFMFPFTGLVIFAGIYLPVSDTVFEPLARRHERIEAAAKRLPFEPAGVPAKVASVDAMVAEAKRRWAARDLPGEAGFVEVRHVGDANSVVSVHRAGSDRVALVGQAIHFEGTTGRVLHEEPPPSTVSGIAEFLTGLHLQHFEHWLLRWLYVLGGLSGCVCIATGMIFFVGKRKLRHRLSGVGGARWVDAIAVTAVTGSVVATLSMLVGNRLLPLELRDRGAWEERVFWLSWLVAAAHAAWRSAPVRDARLAPSWREQSLAIAGLALAAVGLNWVTTGDHLARTLGEPYWPVAGFDLALVAAAFVAVLAARALGRLERAQATLELTDEGETATATPEAARG